jgi:hypothetical protein
VKTENHQPLLDGVVRLLELEDLTPYQLHLLHLTMYYARKQVSMISSANDGRRTGQSKRLRAERKRYLQITSA